MRYLTNFINNIKRICINIKYILCYDFYKLFNSINNTAQNNKANILGQDYYNSEFKKEIDWTHTKMNNLSDMIKIYIEENIEYPLEKLEKDIQILKRNVDVRKEERKDSK